MKLTNIVSRLMLPQCDRNNSSKSQDRPYNMLGDVWSPRGYAMVLGIGFKAR